jgi:hypothetical protein
VPAVAVAVFALMVVLYYLAVLGEAVAGLLLATVVAGLVSVTTTRALLDAVRAPVARAATIALGLVTFALTVAPVLDSVLPGSAVAQGELREPGDSVSLPEDAAGPVRIWLHGAIGGNGPSAVDVELSAETSIVEGHLERTTRQARVGRRGRATVTNERNSDLLSATLDAGSRKLTLTRVKGPLAGSLHVRLFHDPWPLPLDALVGCLVLLAVAALGARAGARSTPASIAGIGLAFGAAAYLWATPDNAVRPEIGALVVGGLLGALAGGVVGRVMQSILAAPDRRSAARPRAAE